MGREKLEYKRFIINQIAEQMVRACNELDIDYNNLVIYEERTFRGLLKRKNESENGEDYNEYVDENLEDIEITQFLEDYDNKIFILVDFGQGTVYDKGIIYPLTITALSQKGTYQDTDNLLEQYALDFNYVGTFNGQNAFIQQAYTTTDMEESFVEDGNNYRARISIEGTIVYGDNVSGITKLEIQSETNGEYVPIIFLDIHPSIEKVTNTADKGNLYGRVSSRAKFKVFNLAFSYTPDLSNGFHTMIDKELYDNDIELNHIYNVRITKNNRSTPIDKQMIIVSVNTEQSITGLSSYAVALAEVS
jgi:hypothetical protein